MSENKSRQYHEDDSGSRCETIHLNIAQHLWHVTFTRPNKEQSTMETVFLHLINHSLSPQHYSTYHNKCKLEKSTANWLEKASTQAPMDARTNKQMDRQPKNITHRAQFTGDV